LDNKPRASVPSVNGSANDTRNSFCLRLPDRRDRTNCAWRTGWALDLPRSAEEAIGLGVSSGQSGGTRLALQERRTHAAHATREWEAAPLPHAHEHDRYGLYREALRRRVCAICLDGADDGRCALEPGTSCPVEEHAVTLVDLLLEMRLRHDTRFAAAVESRICASCPRSERDGRCRSRDDGRCALAVFLPLIVEAIDEVEHTARDTTT
jgi:hypothetical protein